MYVDPRGSDSVGPGEGRHRALLTRHRQKLGKTCSLLTGLSSKAREPGPPRKKVGRCGDPVRRCLRWCLQLSFSMENSGNMDEERIVSLCCMVTSYNA